MSKERWRPATRPKRRPWRADSVLIYESILQAAAELAEAGASACSTNAIAARAGVGVASVYRYFPGREAILAELHRRLQQTLLDHIVAFLTPELTLEEAIEGCVRLELDPPGISRALRRTLILESPLSWSEGVFEVVHATSLDLLTDYLVDVKGLPRDVVRPRMFTALASMLGVVRLHLLQPELGPPLEALVAECTRMLMGYLSAPAPKATHGPSLVRFSS